jgi:hypothetical protein
MACTETIADLRLVAAMGGTPYQGLGTYYLELVYGSVDAATAGSPSGLGRLAVVCANDFTDNGDGTATSDSDLTWTAPESDLPECSYIEFWSASSGGTRHFYELLATPVTPLSGQTVTIPAGQLTWSEV